MSPARIATRLTTGLLVVAIAACSVAAQPPGIPRDDLDRIEALKATSELPPGPRHATPKRSSTTQRLAYGLLRTYRAILSSQDSRSCQFYPSCSHYAEDAIRSEGFFRGSLMASDRLQRCHSKAYNYYPLDETRARLYNPVDGNAEFPTHHPLTMPSPRNRGVAMGLSAVLPGAGQVYAGRSWDGLFSLIQIALPATFSYLNYDRDGIASARGAGHAVLAVGFYFGGIYGAGDAAAKYRIDEGTGAFVVNRLPWAIEELEDAASHYDHALRQWAQGNAREAVSGFRDVRYWGSTDQARRASFFEALGAAKLGRWTDAETALQAFLDKCEDPADRRVATDALRFLVHRRVQREKSARTARVMSGILPGSGQLRAGRPGPAAAAFAVSALIGFYAYRTTDTDSWGEFALFALPTFWRYYRGNIQTAGRLEATRHDRSDYDELQRTLGLRESKR